MPSAAVLPPLDRRERLWLTAILFAGALLRFSGIDQGIPFAIGVDEPEILERAVRMMRSGDYHPDFFDYPTLYMYVQTVVATVRFVAGAMGGMWATLDQAPSSEFYLWGRALTAAIGTATIAVVYLIGRRIGTLAAAAGAILFAFQPMHVRESHYILTDVPVTFLVTLTLLWTLRAHERPDWRRYLLAGIGAGLAAATKYHGGSVLLMPLLTLALQPGQPRRLACAAAATGGALLAFLIGAPYTVLDLPAFLNKFGALSHMYAVGPATPEPAWLIYLKHLRINLGWIGVTFAGMALVLAVARAWTAPARARATWVVTASFVVLGFWLISSQRLIWARYLLPILPSLAVLMGGTVAWIVARLSVGHTTARRLATAAVLVAVVGGLPAWQAVGWTRLNAKTSTAELAYRWIVEHVPARAKVAVETRNLLLPPGAFESVNFTRLIEADLDAYRRNEFRYIVASSRAFGEPLAAREPSEQTHAYRTMFDRLELLTTIAPTSEHPGDEWRVYRIPPR